MDFYIHLQSGNSRAYFPGNKASRFTTKLPETLHLEGRWKVALCRISYPKMRNPTKMTVCGDICGETIVGEKRLPLLRIIDAKKKNSLSFNPAYYMPVRVQEMDRIFIEINLHYNFPSSTVVKISCWEGMPLKQLGHFLVDKKFFSASSLVFIFRHSHSHNVTTS